MAGEYGADWTRARTWRVVLWRRHRRNTKILGADREEEGEKKEHGTPGGIRTRIDWVLTPDGAATHNCTQSGGHSLTTKGSSNHPECSCFTSTRSYSSPTPNLATACEQQRPRLPATSSDELGPHHGEAPWPTRTRGAPHPIPGYTDAIISTTRSHLLSIVATAHEAF